VHNTLHAFCRQDQVCILEILLDTEKRYPLIFRLVGKRGNVSPENFSPDIRGGSQWVSITITGSQLLN